MNLVGICHLCGKPAMQTCSSCGLVTCKACIDSRTGYCAGCMAKSFPENDDDLSDYDDEDDY